MKFEELMERARFPEFIDSSMLSCADSCKQKFFNEYVLCITSHGRSPDLHAGGAFAYAIEHMRKFYYQERLSIAECYMQVFPMFCKYWGDFEPPKESPKDFINMWMAVVEYFNVYPPDTDPIQPYRGEDGKLGIEYTFAIPMEVNHPETGQPMLFVGRFDLLAYYQDALVIVDEKTTKAIGPTWAKQWDLRGQFLGYTWAVNFHGLPCVGALIRGIAIQKTQYKHMQTLVMFPKWQLDRWWMTINQRTQDLCDAWVRLKATKDTRKATDTFERSYGEACGHYGGCQYSDSICQVKNPWDWYDSFEHRVWNPLDQDPTHKAELAETVYVDMSKEEIKRRK